MTSLHTPRPPQNLARSPEELTNNPKGRHRRRREPQVAQSPRDPQSQHSWEGPGAEKILNSVLSKGAFTPHSPQ